jgi:hypothetical protein
MTLKWSSMLDFVKRFYRKSEHGRVLCAIYGMICLAITGPASAAGNTFDGVYTGKRLLTKGPTSAQCPAEDPVSHYQRTLADGEVHKQCIERFCNRL